MTALAGGQSRYPRRRTLRQTQTSTGDSDSRALMNTDSATNRIVHGPEGGGVRGIDLHDLDTRAKRRGLQILNGLVVGEAGEHPGSPASLIFQSRLLLPKLQAFEHDGLARLNRRFHGLFHGVANNGFRLFSGLAISDAGKVLAADEIAETVHLRHYQLIGVHVNANRAQAFVRNSFDPSSCGGDKLDCTPEMRHELKGPITLNGGEQCLCPDNNIPVN